MDGWIDGCLVILCYVTRLLCTDRKNMSRYKRKQSQGCFYEPLTSAVSLKTPHNVRICNKIEETQQLQQACSSAAMTCGFDEGD